MYQDKLCKTCKLFPEMQAHLLQCPQIAPKLKLLGLQGKKIDENYVYSTVENQLQIVKIYKEVLEIRQSIIEDEEHEEI